MNSIGQSESGSHADDPQTLRLLLRADLVAAMKARQPEVVSVLRTALAAIDNAEAIDGSDSVEGAVSGPIAGARAGVGSTEARRRVLTIDDVRALLRSEIDERITAADRYDAQVQRDAAERLRREADVLRKYLVPA